MKISFIFLEKLETGRKTFEHELERSCFIISYSSAITKKTITKTENLEYHPIAKNMAMSTDYFNYGIGHYPGYAVEGAYLPGDDGIQNSLSLFGSRTNNNGGKSSSGTIDDKEQLQKELLEGNKNNITQNTSLLEGNTSSLKMDSSSDTSYFYKFAHISIVSLIIFTSCFIFGMIPLSTSLSKQKMKFCSLFGAGLLVGVALCVIIPEGVQALYNDNDGPKDNILVIGLSLISGFILMLVLDNLSGENSHGHGGQNSSSLDNQAVSNQMQTDEEDHISTGLPTTPNVEYQTLITEENANIESTKPRNSSSTITLGLIVHAAADGIALGAASAAERTDLQFIWVWVVGCIFIFPLNARKSRHIISTTIHHTRIISASPTTLLINRLIRKPIR